MSSKRLIAASLLALVAGLSFVLWGTPRNTSLETHHENEVLEATTYVRANFRDGDTVKIVPNWHEDQWLHLKNMGEGTKRFPFKALLRCDVCDPVTLLKSPRIWVVGVGAREVQPPEPVFEGWAASIQKQFSDGSRVWLFDTPDLNFGTSLSSSLDNATIARRSIDGKERICPRVGGRFRCGKKSWENPSIETRDVFHNEVSWLLAHPPAQGETLLITWPVKRANYLLVRAGLTLKAVRKEKGSPVHVKVFVANKEIDSFELEPHKYALELRVLPLSPEKSTKVRFEVHAEDHEFRQLMLEADTVMKAPPELIREATNDAKSYESASGL